MMLWKPSPREVCLRVKNVPLLILNIKSCAKDSASRVVDSVVRWCVCSGARILLKNSRRSAGVEARRFCKHSTVGDHGKDSAFSVFQY